MGFCQVPCDSGGGGGMYPCKETVISSGSEMVSSMVQVRRKVQSWRYSQTSVLKVEQVLLR